MILFHKKMQWLVSYLSKPQFPLPPRHMDCQYKFKLMIRCVLEKFRKACAVDSSFVSPLHMLFYMRWHVLYTNQCISKRGDKWSVLLSGITQVLQILDESCLIHKQTIKYSSPLNHDRWQHLQAVRQLSIWWRYHKKHLVREGDWVNYLCIAFKWTSQICDYTTVECHHPVARRFAPQCLIEL